MKRMLTAVSGLVLLVVLLPILLTALACRAFIYHPTTLTKREVEALGRKAGWARTSIDVAEDVSLVGLVKASPRPDARWLLFFGGNAADIAGNQAVLDLVRGSSDAPGLAVFAYRGYDGSGGRPSERALEEDASRIAEWLENVRSIPPERLFVAGQSLGTGIAVSLAARLSKRDRPPAGLVLLSPYTSMSALFDEHIPIVPVGWAVKDAYPTDARVGEVSCPIAIIHGEDDALIPIAHGKKLAELAKDRAHLVALPGRGHNDLWSDPRTIEAITSFIARTR
jgi:uncharacterized protein